MMVVPVRSIDLLRDSPSDTEPLVARWQASAGFPPEIARLLNTNDTTARATLILAIPGHEVQLARGARAAPADLWVLARTTRGLLSIVVDGNAKSNAASFADARVDRPLAPWNALWSLLEIDPARHEHADARFVHCTVGALLEARRFFAVAAAVIVHAVDAGHDSFADLQRFVAVMGGRLNGRGHLAPVPAREGIELFFGCATA